MNQAQSHASNMAAHRALGLLMALVEFKRVPEPHLETAKEILADYKAAISKAPA